jgi:hypothetical protein
MAIVTRLAVVLITLLVLMFAIHARLIVFVTQDALEYFVIRRIHMARRAVLPFAAMFAGINAKVLSIVVERRRSPGIHCVARGAIM